MPYTPDDPNLPSNVKALPEAQRRQWAAVFNSTYETCIARSDDKEACETQAFRNANGVIKEAKMALETKDIRGVEVLAVGTWNGHKFTAAMLNQMVEAHEATKGSFDPPVKLGHDDSQKLLQEDGYPAAGWVANLRREDGKLVADLVKVPKKVADLIEAGAYAKRSAEVRKDMELGGKTWPWVFCGLALLGEDIPAVEGLEDIAKLYHTLQLSLEDGAEAIILENADLELDSILADLDRLQVRAERFIKNKTSAPTLRQLHRAYKEGLRRIAGEKKMSKENLAEWTVADINNLPDSAFAYVAPGGEKDGEGKTVPRSLRFLPHHGADGKVDLPHLRNAMARLPQTALPTEAKRKALAHLATHAEEEGVGEYIQEVSDKMLKEQLTVILGQAEDADEEAIVQAVNSLKDKAASQDTVAKLSRELGEAEKRILTLEGENALQKAERQVDEAIQGAKLLPKQRGMAIKLALRDAKEFDEFLSTQPKVIELGERGTSGKGLAELEPSAEEMKIAQQMGNTREALIRQKAAERGVTLPADFGKQA